MATTFHHLFIMRKSGMSFFSFEDNVLHPESCQGEVSFLWHDGFWDWWTDNYAMIPAEDFSDFCFIWEEGTEPPTKPFGFRGCDTSVWTRSLLRSFLEDEYPAQCLVLKTNDGQPLQIGPEGVQITLYTNLSLPKEKESDQQESQSSPGNSSVTPPPSKYPTYSDRPLEQFLIELRQEQEGNRQEKGGRER